MKSNELYIVHCVDTEGPLHEEMKATFNRLMELGVDIALLEKNKETLSKLQKGEIFLDGKEEEISEYLSPARLDYMDSWKRLKSMIESVTNEQTRFKFKDSFGNPYVFSWFIMDFVGFKTNPRKRPEGFHAVWKWYKDLLRNQEFNDGFYWHFHTVPVSGEGTEYNSCWTNNDFHEQVLCRRLHEFGWFPTVFRAGGHIQSLDQSNWLEMFIPFDFSRSDYFSPERTFGDWRDAPDNWDGYHPDFYDNRKKGNMRRKIFRCVEINNGRKKLEAKEIISAFEQVESGKPAVLAYVNHDRRDIFPEVEYCHDLIMSTAKKFPQVKWSYRNALDAVRLCCNLQKDNSPRLTLELKGDCLSISSTVKTFSVMPFISILRKDGVFFRDNAMIEKNFHCWTYKIRRPRDIDSISVAITFPDGSYKHQKINLEDT